MYIPALRPSVWLSCVNSSLRRCARCQGKVDESRRGTTPAGVAGCGDGWDIRCACRICLYCSEKCRRDDFSEHETRCNDIIKMIDDIEEQATHLEDHLVHFEESLENVLDENLFEFGVSEFDRGMCPSIARAYFLSRQRLIEVLVKEGLARADCHGTMVPNELALDAAIFECISLFWLDKYDSYYSRVDGLLPKKEILMNLYLFTGRYQQLYNLCCFYARSGEKYFSHYSQSYINQIGSPSQLSLSKQQDITNSFFLDNDLHHESFPVAALNHMYIMKLMLNEKMEVLSCIDTHFLNSHDCVTTIGEFLGLNTEWIVLEKDWYRNQALEILRPFVGCKASEAQFGKLNGFSDLFFSCANFQRIGCLIADFPQFDTGRSSAHLHPQHSIKTLQLNGCQRQTNVSEIMWEETLRLCKNDHESICSDYIVPDFEVAVAKLNEIAGYDAISMNIDHLAWTGSTRKSHSPSFVITRFVRDAMEICHHHFFEFDDFIDYMDDCYDDDFTYGIMAACVLERKIAQAFYYLSLSNRRADAVLDILPDGSKLRRVRPPPLNQHDPFLTFPLRHFTQILSPDFSDRIKLVSKWLSDVTDVVDALFNAGLATRENLSIFFGDSSIVSNTVWDLQQAKLKTSQQRLSKFLVNRSLLAEGCTQLDAASGLKIHSLTMIERMQDLQDLMKATDGPVKLGIRNMTPLIAEFQDRFGSECLGSTGARCLEIIKSECYGSQGKKPDLHDFDTVEEACKQLFDTSTLAEAILDCVGIPRLVVLNGDEKTMWKSGWRYIGECPLGDRSVQMGSRIALAIDNTMCSHCRAMCSHGKARNFWGEQ